MSGKLCTGEPTNNAGAGLLSQSKAFCEGLAWRAQGTALAYPITDNPFLAGSPDGDAWDSGWTVTNGAAASTVDPDAAPCCAVPLNTILA
jgi:hypothetical protein